MYSNRVSSAGAGLVASILLKSALTEKFREPPRSPCTAEEATQIVTRFFPPTSTAMIDERWVPLFIVNGQFHNNVQGDTIRSRMRKIL